MEVKSIEDLAEIYFSGMFPWAGVDLKSFDGDPSNLLSTPFDGNTQGMVKEAIELIIKGDYRSIEPKGKKRKNLIEKISEGNKAVVEEFNIVSEAIFKEYFRGRKPEDNRFVQNRDEYKCGIIAVAKKNGVYGYNEGIFRRYLEDGIMRERFRRMSMNMNFRIFKNNPRDRINRAVAFVARIKSPQRTAEKKVRKWAKLTIKYLDIRDNKFRKEKEEFIVLYDDLMGTDNEGILIPNIRDEDMRLIPFRENFRIIESKTDIIGGRLLKQTKFFNPQTGKFLDFHNYNIGFIGKENRYVSGGWIPNEFFTRPLSMKEINDMIKGNIDRHFKGVPHETYMQWKSDELVRKGKRLGIGLRDINQNLFSIFEGILSECYFPPIDEEVARIYSISQDKTSTLRENLNKIVAYLGIEKIARGIRNSPKGPARECKFLVGKKPVSSKRSDIHGFIYCYGNLLSETWNKSIDSFIDGRRIEEDSGDDYFKYLRKDTKDAIKDAYLSVVISDNLFGKSDYNNGKERIFETIKKINDFIFNYSSFARRLGEVERRSDMVEYDKILRAIENKTRPKSGQTEFHNRYKMEIYKLLARGCFSFIGDQEINLCGRGREYVLKKIEDTTKKMKKIYEDDLITTHSYYLDEINAISQELERVRQSSSPK